MHLSLWALSGISRIGLIRNWNAFAKIFTRMTHWFLPFGTDTGGMVMNLKGSDHESQKLDISWQLTASSGDGPKIPALPAIILAKKIIRNQLKLRGAMPCMELFTLEEFKKECENLAISFSETK